MATRAERGQRIAVGEQLVNRFCPVDFPQENSSFAVGGKEVLVVQLGDPFGVDI
ncbi:MAG: hypothetical protein GXP24_01545 [Planctomycetes bacterium]|nr:hypothetical protein [Planctomycetota bacterium]